MTNKNSWYRWILFVIVLTAVIWFIVHNLDEIARYNFQIEWLYLTFSFAFVNGAYLVMVMIWIRLSQSFGLNVSMLKAAKAWLLSQLGKYVPGKVTLLLVRFDAYSDYPKRKIAVATGIEYIASLASAGLLILVALASAWQLVPYYIQWVAGIGTILFLFLLWPPLSMKLFNRGLRLLKKEQIEEFPPYGVLLRFVGAYSLAGLLHGMGLFLVLNSFSSVSFAYFLIIAGSYEAAGLIGLAAVFAPSGIGVREGILFLVLPAFIPKPSVIVSVIAIRLLNTIAEVFLTGVFIGAEKYWQSHTGRKCSDMLRQVPDTGKSGISMNKE
ncbi:MAG: flippase-like domain-containing protein [Deltaproteobacteria bacterium]|nr:flippase-like domain-containing protein [Deltaproteobacteria bacterium]